MTIGYLRHPVNQVFDQLKPKVFGSLRPELLVFSWVLGALGKSWFCCRLLKVKLAYYVL